MKVFLLVTGLLSVPLASSAQMELDSLDYVIEPVVIQSVGDSVKTEGHDLPNTIRAPYNEIDSIRNDFNHSADSLQDQYNDIIAKIDTLAAPLKHTIDSLARLDLPSNRACKTLDSLNRARESITSRYASRLNALKSEAMQKLNSLSPPPEHRKPLEEMSQKINTVSIDTKTIEIPELNLPHYDVPQLQSLSDLKSKVGEIGNINDVGDLPKVETELGDVGDISQQLKAYQNDVKDVTSGNIQDMEQFPRPLNNRR